MELAAETLAEVADKLRMVWRKDKEAAMALLRRNGWSTADIGKIKRIIEEDCKKMKLSDHWAQLPDASEVDG